MLFNMTYNLQDGYLSLHPHVKGGLFPLTKMTKVGYSLQPSPALAISPPFTAQGGGGVRPTSHLAPD